MEGWGGVCRSLLLSFHFLLKPELLPQPFPTAADAQKWSRRRVVGGAYKKKKNQKSFEYFLL